MNKFKVGDLVVRCNVDNQGTRAWQRYMQSWGLPINTPATVLGGGGKNLQLYVNGRQVGFYWWEEFFDLAMVAKPLEDYV